MIDDPARTLAKQGNFAATLFPSGQPMTHVMWVDCDDAHLLINTETHRAKYRNDPYPAATVGERVILKIAQDRQGVKSLGREKQALPHV